MRALRRVTKRVHKARRRGGIAMFPRFQLEGWDVWVCLGDFLLICYYGQGSYP